MARIISTDDFLTKLPCCGSARLHKVLNAVSTLELGFRDYEAAGFTYREPVTLMHMGAPIFHGQVTSISPSGSGRAYNTRVVVSDLLWQMERLTLGQQLADLQASQQQHNAVNWKSSAHHALGSWQQLAASCASSAPGWSTQGSGISMNIAEGLPSIGRTLKRVGAVSQWTALRALQQANPGSIFTVDYTTGEVCVFDAFAADATIWNTAERRVGDVSLEPRYASAISGVAVAVTWSNENGSGTRVVKYPENTQTTDEGVRLFTANAADGRKAAAQAEYILPQLKHYYEAASRVQNYGSIVCRAADLRESLLGKAITLQGEGTAERWSEAETIISGEEWDLMTGEVALQVGLDVAAPTFDELSFPDNAGGGDGGDGGGGDGGGGGDDDTDKSKGSRTAPAPDTHSKSDTPPPDEEDELTISLAGVYSEADEGGKYLCSVEWTCNKEADFEVSFDDGGFLEHGRGESGAWTQFVSPGQHTLAVYAKRGNEHAVLEVPLDLQPLDEQTKEKTAEKTDEKPDSENKEPQFIPVWVQVVCTPSNDVAYSADIQAYSQIENARFYIDAGERGEGNKSGLKLFGLRYGERYPYEVSVTDPKTGDTYTKSGVICRQLSDWNDPTPPDTNPPAPDTNPQTDGKTDPQTDGKTEQHTGGQTPDTQRPQPDTSRPNTAPPDTNPPSPQQTAEKCECEGKWTAFETWKANVEERLTKLEAALTTGCDCDCAAILPAIQAALAAAVQQAVYGAATFAVESYSTSWSDSTVMDSNSMGSVLADGTATANSGELTGTVTIRADYT